MIDRAIFDQYEPTIGIECHVQLKTRTKLFSGADNNAREAAPNTTVSPLCFGLPGTLPVLNKEAVTLAIRAGIALNAKIAPISSFDRKHYFYPDLPKGYQITQLARPTVGEGAIDVPLKDRTFTVRITRAHIEEDAGKLTHPDSTDYSLVDLNRAGTPLIEIVSEADMHSPEEAKAYAQELYLLMTFADVTEGNLYHGNMRFDVNISVAKKGASEWGTRAEVKNLNSFKSVERAAEYEFRRQVELLEKGERVIQETRGWHDATQKTFSQRSKENAHDYRYFPEPDLPPIEITSDQIAVIAKRTPQLPPTLRAQLGEFGVELQQVHTLLMNDAANQTKHVELILVAGKAFGKEVALFAANFIINRFSALASEQIVDAPTAEQFAEAFALRSQGTLSSNAADNVLIEISGKNTDSVKNVAEQLGLLQENDLGTLEKIADDVLNDPAYAKAIADIRAGEQKILGFLVGQVMKRSQGKANPSLANQVLKQRLDIS